MNKKGFVLLETLIVTIFILVTFTILYNNAVPLLGRYKEINYYDDLDTTYDLYHLKKYFQKDDKFLELMNNNYQIITCDNLTDYGYCQTLFNYLNITSSDEIIYLKTTHQDEILNDLRISTDVKNYLKYKKIDTDKEIILFQKQGFISYLEFI